MALWPITQSRSGWPQSVGRRVWRSCACVLLACSYGELQCQLVWVASAQGWLIGYLLLRFDRLVTCVPFIGLFFVQCDKSRGLGLAPMLLRLEKGNGLKRQWSLIRQVIFENTLAFKLSPLQWFAKSSTSFAWRLIWRIVWALIRRHSSWRLETRKAHFFQLHS